MPAPAGSPNAYTVRVAGGAAGGEQAHPGGQQLPGGAVVPAGEPGADELGAELGGGLACAAAGLIPAGGSVKSGRTQISGANSSRQVPSRQSTASVTASAQGSRAPPGPVR